MANDESNNNSRPVSVSTLFVGNLPRNATSKQLEEFFSDIGPIRNCFVVADRSKGKVKEDDPQFQNKGVGYVHFAVTDDAQQALEKFKNAKFMGRRLKLDYAQRKSALGEKRQKPSSALQIPEEQPSNKKARTRAARLIVRNLPWKYNEEDLRRIFSEHGQVEDVSLPRKFPGGPLRGFGFVQFNKVKDAETAMAKLNATQHHGRMIAVDWSLSKDRYEKVENQQNDQEEEQETKEEEDNNDSDSSSSSSSSSEEDDDDDEDESESETENAEIEADVEQQEESDEEDDEEESDEDEDDDDEDDDEDDEDEDDEDDEDDQDVEPMDVDDSSSVKKTASKEKTLPAASEGKTLFIRNLLFESTEESLKELFKQWGPVIYARITRNKVSGLSRGTGFVCMKNKADADKCLEEYNRFKNSAIRDDDDAANDSEMLMTKREKKKKGLVFDSILTPDAGSGSGLKFTLDGRVLDITRAVERQDATKLTEEKENLRKKEDKRNLYLMHEGVVFPGTPAAESMSEAELQKRQLAFATRKRLMSRDPALYISKTRLSIRNLPISVDDSELKKLGHSAVQKFKDQVKRGLRSDLTKEEKEEGWQYLPKVKQAKIVRSKDRVDSATNKLRSKGYGFLEFTTHAHALAALRYLNNNPEIFKGKRLIIEFSLENKDVVERRKNRGKSTDSNNIKINGKRQFAKSDSGKSDGGHNKKHFNKKDTSSGGKKHFNKKDSSSGGKKHFNKKDSSSGGKKFAGRPKKNFNKKPTPKRS